MRDEYRGQYRHKLRNKVMGSCAAFAVVLSVLIGGLGYYRYKVNMEASYENYAGTLLTIAADSIDEESLAACIRAGREDESYRELQEELNRMKADSDARYIYMIEYPGLRGNQTRGDQTKGDQEIRYVVTAYTEEELATEGDTVKHLGDPAGEADFTEAMQAAMRESIREKSKEVQFIDNNTEVAGNFLNAVEYVKTAFLPIFTADGEPVGVICLDISMTQIYDSLRSYLLAVAVGTLGIAAAFLMIFLTVINRQVINPVRQLAEQADDFVRQSRTVSEPSALRFRRVETKTGDEIELLSDSLAHMVDELIRYMLDMRSMAAVQERMAAEIQVARQLQLGLCPCRFPAFPERNEFDIFAEIRFAKEAGGDFYNFFFTDTDHLCVTAGTVSGSGVPTTMMAAITSTLLKSCASLGYPPSRIFAETNNQLSRDNRAELNISAFLGILQLTTGKFDFTAAGDMDALYKTAGGRFEELESRRGIRLGAMEHISYPQSTVHMVQGDLLFLCSSGLKETVDPRGNIYSGEYVKSHIDELVRREVRPEGMVRAMLNDVDVFRETAERVNDNTAMILRYFG